MALNFPNNRDQLDPPQPSGPLQDGDAFTDAGQTWTWNSGLGVWSTEAGGGADLDALYLSKRSTMMLLMVRLPLKVKPPTKVVLK